MRHTRVLVACSLSCLCVLSIAPSASAFSARDARASRAMVKQLNYVRSAHGLPRLQASRTLRRGAFRHSRLMMARDVFAHARLSRIRGLRRLREIIALPRRWRGTVRWTVRRWLASRPHRAIVLSSNLRYVGAAGTRGRFRGRRSTAWVVRLGGR